MALPNSYDVIFSPEDFYFLHSDEFIAFIHDVPSKEVAINIAWKICEKVKEIKYKDNQNIITVSIGVSYTGESGYNYRLLKDIADDRLYIAKRSGKDKVISE